MSSKYVVTINLIHLPEHVWARAKSLLRWDAFAFIFLWSIMVIGMAVISDSLGYSIAWHKHSLFLDLKVLLEGVSASSHFFLCGLLRAGSITIRDEAIFFICCISAHLMNFHITERFWKCKFLHVLSLFVEIPASWAWGGKWFLNATFVSDVNREFLTGYFILQKAFNFESPFNICLE